MISTARQTFNAQFSTAKYEQFLADLNQTFGYTIPFRVAETPVFVPQPFFQKLAKASEEIIDFLVQPDFATRMEGAIPAGLAVPNQTPHTLFLALDFAVCHDEAGALTPKLIEMQGFPSLFGYQDFLGQKFGEHYQLPGNLQYHFGYDHEGYWRLVREAVIGEHDPQEVVLLEIEPLKQNTAIDFLITQKQLNLAIVSIDEVIRRGDKLYYKRDGVDVPIKRIYNRVIFDELQQRKDLSLSYRLTEPVAVEWAGHPNWFFLISKFTMPFLQSEFVPPSQFLHQYNTWPHNLENYVLKPLYSFSGSGVLFNVTANDLNAIAPENRNHYLLQRKVVYQPVVQAPDGLVKTEIRLLFIWLPGQPRPQLVTNLARLSRGEMIGVKFNKNKTWVGGTIAFFER